ncbi:MOSC domain-containing protein [Alkalihalobacillus oceani]|uniref:MOSC domain-containing protein n=1 Tax=Halalkalibacter oceani TaxID=1653776 RepID=A0A9X2DQK8_9BACI|nr:MOSC domain-containing protein [Halalkalibacter oceani]MCM3713323.1 MOSC domain-containing protein [Halalkalibacter oceani]
MSKSFEITNVAVAPPKQLVYGQDKELYTGIAKQFVSEVFLTKDGFNGDDVADKKHHGGRDRAVCLYPAEHYAKWNEEFSTSLPASAFGENITVKNRLERDVYIGDIYQLGEAVIQVTQGREPCHTIEKHTAVRGLLKRLVQTGYTGYLCRVLEEGTVRADSDLKLLEENAHRVSVLEANEVYLQRNVPRDALERLLTVPELAEHWRNKLQQRI